MTDGQNQLKPGSKISTRDATAKPRVRSPGGSAPAVDATAGMRRRPRIATARRRLRAGDGDGAVSISEPFIRRPVATTLLMIGLLLAGLVAFRLLPVSALPQVDYPTIVVSTTLPGGRADTMASSVTTPLERQFGQMPSLRR